MTSDLPYMTLTEAAERLCIAKQRVQQLIAKGDIASHHLSARVVLIARAEVERYAIQRAVDFEAKAAALRGKGKSK